MSMVGPAFSMRPAGFEPTTYCLEGSCSILMSYDLKKIGTGGFEPPIFWSQTRCLSH